MLIGVYNESFLHKETPHFGGTVHWQDGYSATISVTDVNSWYRVGGITMEEDMVGFSDGGGTMDYDMDWPIHFKITSSITIQSDTNKTQCIIEYLKNSSRIIEGTMALTILDIDQAQCVPVFGVTELYQNDTLDMVIKANKICTLTIYHTITNIRS